MSETEPLLENTEKEEDDDKDTEEDEENKNPFQPVGSSTPMRKGDWIGMQTMQKEKSGLPKPDTSYTEEETSFGGTGVEKITDWDIEKRLAALRNDDTGLYSSDKINNHLKGLREMKKIKKLKN